MASERPLSLEAFRSRIPAYVELVHSITGAIINKALTEPQDSIQVCALLPPLSPATPGTSDYVPTTDPEAMAFLWQNQRPDCMFEVEVALGDLSLSIQNNPTQMTGGWLHQPETPTNRALPRQINAPMPRLLSPVLTFDRAWRDGSAASPTSASIYIFAESTYNHGKLAAGYGRHQNMMQVSPEFYLQAFNPPLSEADEHTLRYGGVYALHARKIDSFIEVLRSVVPD